MYRFDEIVGLFCAESECNQHVTILCNTCLNLMKVKLENWKIMDDWVSRKYSVKTVPDPCDSVLPSTTQELPGKGESIDLRSAISQSRSDKSDLYCIVGFVRSTVLNTVVFITVTFCRMNCIGGG
jgi:hypothetical protein